MTILSAQSIALRVDYFRLNQQENQAQGDSWQNLQLAIGIEPFEADAKQAHGMSYGLSAAGYDIRIGKIDRTRADQLVRARQGHLVGHSTKADEPVQQWLVYPHEFVLLSSLERLKLPNDILATVHDKSTLARQGLALQNTVLEPGWEGYITLELSNHGPNPVVIRVGQPIAQVVFQRLDLPTNRPYRGKYQNQEDAPVHARLAEDVRADSGLKCPDCGEPQFETPSGTACKNGHGY